MYQSEGEEGGAQLSRLLKKQLQASFGRNAFPDEAILGTKFRLTSEIPFQFARQMENSPA